MNLVDLRTFLRVPCLAAFIVAVVAPAKAQIDPEVQLLPQLLDWYTGATAVSADGRVVVGGSTSRSQQYGVFRWSEEDGIEDLGLTGSNWVNVVDVSADGSVIVGNVSTSSGYRGFMWTRSQGVRYFQDESGRGEITGISSNGRTIVGTANNPWPGRAAIWDLAGNISRLEADAARRFSMALDASRDGSVVVGRVDPFDTPNMRGFRWTGNGMTILGRLNLWEDTQANAVSTNGLYVAGAEFSNWTGVGRAVRWDASGVPVNLGTLGNAAFSTANGVSDDGQTVIGTCGRSSQNQNGPAFIWTASTGMRELPSPNSSSLAYNATDVSADGRVVVGTVQSNGGISYSAAIWRFPTPAIRWRVAHSGRFDDSSNWEPPLVPGPRDTVIFDLPGSYSVEMEVPRSFKSLEVRAGDVRFEHAGHTLSIIETGSVLGNLTVAGGTLRVGGTLQIGSSGTLNLAQVTQGVPAAARVEGGVGGAIVGVNNAGTISGVGTVSGVVVNGGTIRASLIDQANRTLRFEGVLTCVENDPAVTMEIEIGAVPPLLAAHSSIETSGSIEMHGRLVINVRPDADPVVGLRLNAVSGDPAPEGSESLRGRFDSVGGTFVDESRWFAVNHEFARLRSVFDRAPDEFSRTVQLLTCEAPQRHISREQRAWWADSSGQAPRSVMLVTHGTESQIRDDFWLDDEGGFAEMAARAAEFASDAGLADQWDVVSLDWGKYVGSEIAWSLSHWLDEADLRLTRAHLLSHSSGTWLINSLSRSLVENSQVSAADLTLTAFDTFSPPGTCVIAPGFPCMNLGPFGDAVPLGAAEQYVDMVLPTTNAVLPNVYNIGVTDLFDLADDGLGPRHSWPYIWYSRTIPRSLAELQAWRCDAEPSSEWGFVRSPMCQDLLGSDLDPTCAEGLERLRSLSSLVVLPGGLEIARPRQWWHILIDPGSTLTSNTGTVTFGDGGLDALTGSPVWARSTIQIPGRTDFIRFTAAFSDAQGTSGRGTLTVLLDGELVTTVTHDSVQGLATATDWILLPPSTPAEKRRWSFDSILRSTI